MPTYTITTDDRDEALKHINGPMLADSVDEFLSFLRRFDKHRDLTEEQQQILKEIREQAEYLTWWR